MAPATLRAGGAYRLDAPQGGGYLTRQPSDNAHNNPRSLSTGDIQETKQ